MSCLCQISVNDLAAGSLDPRFCTVTIRQAPGGTMLNVTPWNVDGSMPVGSMVIADVLFDELCGWTFDHWDVNTQNLTKHTSNVTTSRNNPHNVMLSLAGVDDGDWLFVEIHAYGHFNGTGKLMRSSQQQSKLIRVGDKLLIDN